MLKKTHLLLGCKISERLQLVEKKYFKVVNRLLFFVFSLPEIHLTKKGTYKTKKQNHSEVQEPLAIYGISHNLVVINDVVIPDGYMSLEQFGEIFHKKLDASYENLQNNRKH